MRADDPSWPYQDPSGDNPDWAAGNGHPSWPAGSNGQDWTAGDDSWLGGSNGPNWAAGDDRWPGSDSPPAWPYGEDHPSWPAGSNGPNWTAGDDRWPGGDNPPAWPYGEDHPSWPAGSDRPDWPRGGGRPASQGREAAAGPQHDPRRPTAPPSAPAARVRVPAGGPDGTQQWPGQSAMPADAAAPYYEVAFGDGRVQVLLPSASQDWPTGADAGSADMRQLTGEGPAELLDPVRQDAGGFR